MSSLKQYLIAISIILCAIFLGLVLIFHYYYFTRFYWDCRNIGNGDSTSRLEEVMGHYKKTNMTNVAKTNDDETITYTNDESALFCQVDMLEKKVVSVNFFTLSL